MHKLRAVPESKRTRQETVKCYMDHEEERRDSLRHSTLLIQEGNYFSISIMVEIEDEKTFCMCLNFL